MAEDSTTSTGTNNNHPPTTATTTAEDAVRKAQEIVARLSNQYPIVVNTNQQQQQQQLLQQPQPTTMVNPPNESSNTDDTSPTNNAAKGSSSKRKRWGIMSDDDASKRLVTTTTTTTIDGNPSVIMANPQIPIAQQLLLRGNMTAAPSALGTTTTTTTTTTTPISTTIKRLWVTVNHERPAAHYVAYIRPKLRRIIAEANGVDTLLLPEDEEKIDEKDATQEDVVTNDQSKDDNDNDNDNDETKLRIIFKGKGSTNIPPLPGVPEEPLHIYMTGPKHLVDQTTSKIDILITEASHAEPLIDAVIKAQQAQELALIQTMESIQNSANNNNNNNSYQPASVTALISKNDHNNSNSNALLALPADRLAAALLHGTTASLTQEMEVPNPIVGTIIGRGGETIAAIQAQTNCKIQIQKENDMIPGQIHRIITLSANTQSAIDACQSIVQSLINERIQKLNPSNNSYGPSSSSSSSIPNTVNQNIVLLDGSTVPSHYSVVDVLVPDADVGLIIGKMGVTIKQIQEQSGANVHVPKIANADNPTLRTLQVTCPNLDGANLAKQLIEDVLKTKPGYGNNNGGSNQYQQQQQQQQQVALQVSVPDKDVGLCIGRGGCVIKYMQSTTQTRIQIPPTVPNPGDMYRIITVTGPSMEACQQVQSMIHRILSEQSSAGVMSGQHTTGYQQQQQQYGHQTTGTTTPQINQPGYTAEWAAYHAAQQQTQVQYQAAGTAAVTTTVTGTQQGVTTNVAVAGTAPATNEYTEPFFRYAYYYGEEAARQYYGAWSPPVGTPNPYGVNPNGITTPTVATTTTTTATAATVETTTNVGSTESTSSGIQNYGTVEQQQQQYQQQANSNSISATTDEAATGRETSQRHVSNLPAWMTKK